MLEVLNLFLFVFTVYLLLFLSLFLVLAARHLIQPLAACRLMRSPQLEDQRGFGV